MIRALLVWSGVTLTSVVGGRPPPASAAAAATPAKGSLRSGARAGGAPPPGALADLLSRLSIWVGVARPVTGPDGAPAGPPASAAPPGPDSAERPNAWRSTRGISAARPFLTR